VAGFTVITEDLEAPTVGRKVARVGEDDEAIGVEIGAEASGEPPDIAFLENPVEVREELGWGVVVVIFTAPDEEGGGHGGGGALAADIAD